MQLSRIAWIVALLLVLLVSVIVSVPSRVLSHLLPPQQIIMQGFAGTVWRGSASRCLLRLPAGYLHLGAVSWSLEPLSLLLLAPRVQLHSDWGDQTLSADLVLRSAQSLDVYDLDGRVSADLLKQFAPLDLKGNFSMQIQALQLRDGLPVSGEGRLVWQQGAWLSPRGALPLGSYALEFQQEPGAALQGQVLTLQGPLEATGNVQLQGRSYTLDVLLRSASGLDSELRDALSLIAAPESDGYRLKLGGDF